MLALSLVLNLADPGRKFYDSVVVQWTQILFTCSSLAILTPNGLRLLWVIFISLTFFEF